MAGDLLHRIIGEIRDRKREAQAAYEESQQLERALAALDDAAGRDGERRWKEAGPARPRGKRRAGGRAPRGANREAILAAVRERSDSTAR